MSQQYRYPNSASVTVAAVGTNGAVIPSQSILVAGEDNLGNLTPIAVDTDGNVQVDIITIPLPTGASTAANQVLEIGELQDIEADVEAMSAKLPATLGQKAMAASLAVAIASDQSAIPASQSGTWNINNVSGTVSLPTGAASAANQTTMINSLSSIDSKNPALVGGRVPVDGSGVTQPISAASLPLPTGAATQTSLAQISDTTAANGGSGPSRLLGISGYDGTNMRTLSLQLDGSLNVNLPQVQALNGGSTSAQMVMAGGRNAGSGLAYFFEVDTSGRQAVTVPTQLPASLGQKAMAASLAVVLASDQSSIPVAATQSGTWNTNATPVVPAALTVKQAAISVGTTAVRLTTDGSAPSATRRVLVVNCDSAVTAKFYIGSSSVANSGASRGIQLIAGQVFQADNDAGDYYIISDTATQTIFVTEQE